VNILFYNWVVVQESCCTNICRTIGLYYK